MYLDLTQLIHRDMLVWTNNPKPELSVFKTFEKDGVLSEKLCVAIHTGTHVDVPIHFVPGTASVEQVPIETFVGDALVLNVPVTSPDYQLTMDDFTKAMSKFGNPTLKGMTLLFATGWDAHLASEEMYLRSCAGFGRELADHLVSIGVKAVGLDTPSLDYYKSPDYSSHKILLGAGMVGYENLLGITKLVDRKIRFYALPMKLKGATGSPVRAIAEF